MDKNLLENSMVGYKISKLEDTSYIYCPYIPLNSGLTDPIPDKVGPKEYLKRITKEFMSNQQGECNAVLTRKMKEKYPGNYRIEVTFNKSKLIFDDPKEETMFILKNS